MWNGLLRLADSHGTVRSVSGTLAHSVEPSHAVIISEVNRYVYVGIPKTGSTSMMHWLMDYHGGYENETHHSWKVPRDILRDGDYQIFTVVRDPYDWCYSKWWWNCMSGRDNGGSFEPGMDFIDFLQQVVDYRDNGGDPVSARALHMTQSEYYKASRCNTFLRYEDWILPNGAGENGVALEHLPQLPWLETRPDDCLRKFPHQKKRNKMDGDTFWRCFEEGSDEVNAVWEYCGEDFETFDY